MWCQLIIKFINWKDSVAAAKFCEVAIFFFQKIIFSKVEKCSNQEVNHFLAMILGIFPHNYVQIQALVVELSCP